MKLAGSWHGPCRSDFCPHVNVCTTSVSGLERLNGKVSASKKFRYRVVVSANGGGKYLPVSATIERVPYIP